ncbi:MAG: sulfatase [Victivallales bacterium]|nr:sulfatase [Victivallales bacterium]
MTTTRRDFLRSSALLAGTAAFSPLAAAPPAGKRRNVLFIAVDDLRPQLGCYGREKMKTPNIDGLAAQGTLFQRAYCQQAVCSPSRTSLMTGLRPETTRVYDLQTHFRGILPDTVTVAQHFKQNGYFAQGFGKIYHGSLDDPASWSVKSWRPRAPGYLKPETIQAMNKQRQEMKKAGLLKKRKGVLVRDPKTGVPLKLAKPGPRVRGPAWENPVCGDSDLPDGKTCDEVIRVMGEVKDKPFFLACGFVKPHLPFVAPKRYYDLYPKGSLEVADNPFPPKDVPKIALHRFGEMRSYSDIPNIGPVDDELALKLIHGYYAATSYIDALVGKLLAALKANGLAENTVVILWGDHGWQLGEHGLWCKHSNFETSCHVPMICYSPDQKAPGKPTKALTEFVDIYPSLCDLAGLSTPGFLEGTSFAPLMDNPDRPWKSAAFSLYPRGRTMGWSMRTAKYRYTEWGHLKQKPEFRELYDHDADPDENVNLANLPEHADTTAKLSEQLHKGWRGALPPA